MARAAAQTSMSDGSPGPFRGAGRRVGQFAPQDTHYLILLYVLEYALTYWLRYTFRRAHGG